MIVKIIVTLVLLIIMVSTMYGSFEGIRTNDKKLSILCAIASSLVGLLCGFILGSICFSV